MPKISEPAAQLSKEEIKHRKANVHFAQASLALEGFYWDDATKKDLNRYLTGELTIQELLLEAHKQDGIATKERLARAATANKS